MGIRSMQLFLRVWDGQAREACPGLFGGGIGEVGRELAITLVAPFYTQP